MYLSDKAKDYLRNEPLVKEVIALLNPDGSNIIVSCLSRSEVHNKLIRYVGVANVNEIMGIRFEGDFDPIYADDMGIKTLNVLENLCDVGVLNREVPYCGPRIYGLATEFEEQENKAIFIPQPNDRSDLLQLIQSL